MKKAALFAAFAVLIPSLCAAQETLVRFQPEPDFEAIVSKSIQAVQPQDAFSAAPECRIVDARFIKAPTIDEAEKMLKPCADALSSRYGSTVLATHGTPVVQDGFSAQVEMLKLEVPAGTPATSPLMRDLNRGLSLRNGRILGHRAFIEREADKKVDVAAAGLEGAQSAIDRCILPMVVRKIESGDDFIKYYGGCLRKASDLRVVDMKPWPGHKLGVVIMTDGGRVVAQSMTGPVSVVAANGPVKIDLVAYTPFVERP